METSFRKQTNNNPAEKVSYNNDLWSRSSNDEFLTYPNSLSTAGSPIDVYGRKNRS